MAGGWDKAGSGNEGKAVKGVENKTGRGRWDRAAMVNENQTVKGSGKKAAKGVENKTGRGSWDTAAKVNENQKVKGRWDKEVQGSGKKAAKVNENPTAKGSWDNTAKDSGNQTVKGADNKAVTGSWDKTAKSSGDNAVKSAENKPAEAGGNTAVQGGGAWKRRGEWLEAMPGRAVTGAADKDAAIDLWLLETAGMPVKLHARLRREGGIQWRGDRLRLALWPQREAGIEPVWQGAEVLYEDDFCLIVHKPAGMAVHPDGSGSDTTLDHLVAGHYAASGGGIAVRHIHRLDKDTTGPVLYAKNEYAQLVLDEDMRSKDISRRYAAIAEGAVPAQLTVIDAPIGRDRHHASRRRVSPGGQPAVTRITGREVLRGATALQVELETGRTHQIRVHLSHAGHPLIGDELYGGPRWGLAEHGRQALHGEALAFRHPWTRELTVVADPWPEDMLRLRESLGGAPL